MKKLLLIPIMALSLSFSETFQVTKVIDGDTLLLNNGKVINLAGIDAPEFKPSSKLSEEAYSSSLLPGSLRNYGRTVKNLLSKTLTNKSIEVKYTSENEAVVFYNGNDINQELVYNGLAISTDDRYEQAEFDAEVHSIGFWKIDDKLMMVMRDGKASYFDLIGTPQTSIFFLGKEVEIKQSRTFYS